MYKSMYSRLVIFGLVLALMMMSCDLTSPAQPPAPPPPPQSLFATLPMPAYGHDDTIASVLTLGDFDQVEMISHTWDLRFGQTGGKGPGEAEHERISFGNNSGVATVYTFGTIGAHSYEVARYSGNGKLLEAVVRVAVKGTNLVTLVTTPGHAIDKSALYLYYRGTDSRNLTLTWVYYNEIWGGTNETDALAMGVSAFWYPQNLPSSMNPYTRWGFWENAVTFTQQKDMVINALDIAQNMAQTVPADLTIVDEDSITELIGHQTGLKYYAKGKLIGTVTFEYGNWLAGLVGPDALSRIVWNIQGKTYELVILRNALAVPSWIYIFAEGDTVSKKLSAMPVDQWPSLYSQLENDTLPGVISAVYVTGAIDGLWVNMNYTDSGEDGTENKTSSSQLGTKGGRIYMMMYDYGFDRLYTSSQLLAMLGKGGITALGISFPTIGTGLNYYLTAESINSSETPFANPQASIARMDLVGNVDLDWFSKQIQQ